MRAFVELDRWMQSFERSARQRRDNERLKLTLLHRQGWRLLQSTPEEALVLFDEGARLARQLHEPRWELWYEYWCCEAYLYYLAWVEQAERWAVHNFVKAHQPAYRDCPFIGRIYMDFLNILFYRDAEGEKDRIEQMLDYVEQHVPLEYDTYTRIIRFRADLYYVIEDWEAAARYGNQQLELVQTLPFHKMDACLFLASIAYYQKRPQDILIYAQEAEHAAQHMKNSRVEGMARIAQAYALIQLQESEKAHALYEQGMRLSVDTSMPRAQAWYNYACGYQEAFGNLPAALSLRDQQLEALLVRNLPAHEANCRFARLRLLGKMEAEEQFKSELETTRQGLTRLKSSVLKGEKLQRIEAGDYS